MNGLSAGSISALPPQLLEFVNGGLWAVDQAWTFTQVNAEGEQLAGIPRAQLLGRSLWDVFPELCESDLERRCRADGSTASGPWKATAVIRRRSLTVQAFPSDTILWLLFRETDDSPAGKGAPDPPARAASDGVAEELRRAEDRIRRNHDTFYHLIQNNPFGVYVVDADFRLRQVSLGSQKVFSNVRPLLGRDFAEILRLIWTEPFATEAIGRFRHTLETGEPYSAPSTVERRQDIAEIEAYDWRIERITLPDGRFGVVCYFYDLSERQRWEEALRRSEEKYRQLFDSMSEGFMLIELVCSASGRPDSYRFLEVNPAMERLTGLRRENMIGRDVREVLPGIEPYWIDAFVRTASTGEPVHIEQFSRDLNAWYEVFAFCPQPGTAALICTNVTDRKRTQEALAAAKAAAEEASRAKSAFLANMSHELRTPLNAIIGYSEMIQEGGGCPEDIRSDVEKISFSGKHLLQLINSVLDLAKIEAGRVEVASAPFDVQELAGWCTEAVHPTAALNGNTLSLHCAPGCGRMISDAGKIRQVLLNLLGNAAKFTDNGTIELHVSRSTGDQGDLIVFQVRDSGIGIAPGDQEQLFHDFVQLDGSTTRKYEGTGLGLSITRRLCTLLGGSVSLSSAPGRGSCFTATFPAEYRGPAAG